MIRNTRKVQRMWLVMGLIGAAVLSACDVLERTAVSQPVPTILALTPLPSATATPLRFPTTISPPSSPLPTLAPVAAALRKTQAARAHRVALQLTVKQGNAPEFTFNLKGDVAGDNARYSYQVGSEQIELVAARGQFYVKGARSIGLPNVTKWYIVTPDLADAARPPFSPEEVLSGFIEQAGNVNYQPLARESLDGQNCQVWRNVPKTLAETGIGYALGSDQTTTAFSALDQAEVKLWVCDDGALHQIGIDIAAHNPKQTTQKGTAKLLVHIWDMGAAIAVDAPASAEPFRLRVPTP